MSTGLGFAIPALLAAIPVALGLLVYVYRNKGQSQAVLVSSVLLLKPLKRSRPARKKFIPPLRFFIELALFTLLTISAAGLFKEGGKKRVALLIDNSMSMGATDLSHHAAESLFTQAKKQAESYLDSLELGSEVKLYASSPLLTLIEDSALTPSSAARALNDIELAYAPDRLDAALASLAVDPSFDRITAISHRRAMTVTQSQRAMDPNLATDPRISFITIGDAGSSPNVGIIDLSRAQNEQAVRLNVSVAAKSREKVAGSVVLKSVNIERLEREVKRESIEVQPGETKALSFGGLSTDLAYKVELVGFPAASDTLKEDNVGWIAASEQRGKATVVSELSVRELGLDRIPSLSFAQISPDQYAAQRDGSSQASKANGILIFHDYVPGELPSTPALFIAPPPGDPLFNAGATIAGAELGVTGWSESHPVASYINFAALKLRELTPLPLPDWATSIVNTTAGAAIIVGERANIRYAIVGFELLPFEAARSPLLSILTLNILRWLSDSKLGAGFIMLPSAIRPESEVLSIRSPAGELSTRPTDKVWEFILAKPGLYQVERRSGESFIAANFLNEGESDLLGNAPIALPVSSISKQQRDDNYYLREIILPPILAALLLELLIWVWRAAKGSSVRRAPLSAV